jgi:hypothetical protein
VNDCLCLDNGSVHFLIVELAHARSRARPELLVQLKCSGVVTSVHHSDNDESQLRARIWEPINHIPDEGISFYNDERMSTSSPATRPPIRQLKTHVGESSSSELLG